MQLIAHRGASGHAPENTMAAFRLALELGAKAVELDIHQTKDRELAVIHDFDLKRVGRRKGRVRDLSLRELSAVDVGSWFDKRFKDERVPRLEAVLDLCAGKAAVHVEIKKGSSLYHGIEEQLVDLIQRRKAWETIVVSSFDHEALYRVRSLDARVRIGYLRGLATMRTAFRELKELKGESLHMSLSQVTGRRVKETRQRGFKLLIYTVNAPKDIARLGKLGVDGVFCNFPELAA